MNNVVRLHRFDDDITEVLEMVNPTPPHGVPFQTLLAGPASDPDAGPTRHPRPAWWTTFNVASASYFLGVLQTIVILRWF